VALCDPLTMRATLDRFYDEVAHKESLYQVSSILHLSTIGATPAGVGVAEKGGCCREYIVHGHFHFHSTFNSVLTVSVTGWPISGAFALWELRVAPHLLYTVYFAFVYCVCDE